MGENGEEVLTYFVDGAAAEEETFQAVCQAQEEKEDALWRPFTQEELESAFQEREGR